MATAATATRSARTPLANIWHLVVVLLILVGVIIIPNYLRLRKATSGSPTPAVSLSPSRLAIDMGIEWLLLIYVWAGVRRKGGRMQDLTGGRWASWPQAARDVAIFVPFWILWTATAKAVWWLIGQPVSHGANLAFPPHGALTIAAWLATSATAGFCEEVIYRGYLQKQFYAFSGNVGFALLAQALFFGVSHIYQGARSVVVVSVLGLLYGALAQWQRNLRSAMLSHAWSDMFEGYFKHLLPSGFH